MKNKISLNIKKSNLLSLFFFGLVLIASVFTLLPNQVQAGWTEKTSAGLKNWAMAATSFDGEKIFAIEIKSSNPYESYINKSIDGGETWTEIISAGSRIWTNIASSFDGKNLVATVSNGYIYTSQDYGLTWNEQIGSGQNNWNFIISSSDGKNLVATVSNGYLYTSQDFGVNWLQQTSVGQHYWKSIASSSDGKNLVAIMGSGSDYIRTSTDYGVTWTTQGNSSGSKYWSQVASSSNGDKLVATVIDPCGGCFGPGNVYISNDFGATWSVSSDSGSWKLIASNSNGDKLIASKSDYLYISDNSGITWTQQIDLGSKNWSYLASLLDGSRFLALEQYISYPTGGYIYTYAPDDTIPNSFTLTDQTGVSLSTPTESNTITIGGINASTPIGISSCTSVLCEYKINSGAYTSIVGNVVNGDTVTVRQTSSDTQMTTTDLILDIGGVTDTFSVTTTDTTNPVINLIGSSNIAVYKGTTYVDQGATANDNIDGDITFDIVTVNPVDTNTTGIYIITYNVDDSAGNHATEVSRIVNVKNRPSSGSNYRIVNPVVTIPTPIVTSCSPGDIFDTNTGQLCTSISLTPISGCSIGNLFSTTTGASCGGINQDINLPSNPNIPTSTSLDFTRTLKLTTPRMIGVDVKELQNYLNLKNHNCGIADGIFGEKTKQAVISFQIANGLIGDGVVGTLTRELLK